VIDTMAVSALINPDRSSSEAAEFRDLVGGRVTVVSFMTVTELRYGALKAGWGEFRRRGLERDLDQFTVVEPDDEMMQLRAALRARCERVGHGLGQKIHEADQWIAAARFDYGSRSCPTTASSPASTGCRSSPAVHGPTNPASLDAERHVR
jgi:predicted nucleic acid-binding protein